MASATPRWGDRNVVFIVGQDGNGNLTPGGLSVTSQTVSAPNVTSVAADTSSRTILAANSARLGLVVFNDSTATMYLKFGTGATTSSFTYKITGGTTFEMTTPIYTGAISALWDAATGNIRVTES